MTTGWGTYANEREDMPRMARGMTTAVAAEGGREWADDLWRTLDAGGQAAFAGLDIGLTVAECCAPGWPHQRRLEVRRHFAI